MGVSTQGFILTSQEPPLIDSVWSETGDEVLLVKM